MKRKCVVVIIQVRISSDVDVGHDDQDRSPYLNTARTLVQFLSSKFLLFQHCARFIGRVLNLLGRLIFVAGGIGTHDCV